MDRNTLKTTFLLTLLAAIFVGLGSIFGRVGILVGLAVALVFTFGSYWFSDTVAIRAARAVEVSPQQMPEYYAIVQELCARAGLPMPRLYVTPDLQPNAFATGRNPSHAAVAVTQGLLQLCSWDEIRGVLAHELSHVRNRDILIASVAATVAMAITLLARMAAWGGLLFSQGSRREEGENIFELLALVILAPLAATLLQLALSRSREFEADRSGARLIGDGEPLARALLKLDTYGRQIPMNVPKEMAGLFIANPLAGGRGSSFARWFSDHPPTPERIARLRSQEWAR